MIKLPNTTTHTIAMILFVDIDDDDDGGGGGGGGGGVMSNASCSAAVVDDDGVITVVVVVVVVAVVVDGVGVDELDTTVDDCSACVDGRTEDVAIGVHETAPMSAVPVPFAHGVQTAAPYILLYAFTGHSVAHDDAAIEYDPGGVI